MKFVFDNEENIVKKGENAGYQLHEIAAYQHFLHFFQRLFHRGP